MGIRLHRLSLGLAVASILAATACDRTAQHAARIRQIVQERAPSVDGTAIRRATWEDVRAFYAARQFAPAWFKSRKGKAQVSMLAGVVAQAHRHGFDPADFDPRGRLRAAAADEDDRTLQLAEGIEVEEERVAPIDIWLTSVYVSLARDVRDGRTDPARVFADWKRERRSASLGETLSAAVDSGEIVDAIEHLAPAHAQYRQLGDILAKEWDRLRPAERARIVMNMERWRWMPAPLPARYLLVQIPAYTLIAFETDRPVLVIRAIVGRTEDPSPVFADTMTTVVFSPYWNIPPSIAEKEILPKLANDPDYLTRNNMEFVRDERGGERIRQRPGPTNALGHVKFVFPNRHNVYIHDTPTGHLFRARERDLSHGCVRIEDPEGLARYVLRGAPKWTDAAIGDAMHSNDEQHVAMPEQIPVFFYYLTAWAVEGRVKFYDDIYGYDEKQLASGFRPRASG